jgi:hypothetical protein
VRNLGDLVPMPLPTQWGPTVLPPGATVSTSPAQSTLDEVAAVQVIAPPGSQVGWNPVSGGWALGWHNGRGFVRAPGSRTVSGPGIGPATVPPPAVTAISPVLSVPGGPWQRERAVPNAMLPPTLNRTNPLLRFVSYTPNACDANIKGHAARWTYIATHGGLKSCCRIPELGAPIYNQPPWVVQPSNGEKIEEMFFQQLTAFQSGGAYTGDDVVLGQFVIPNGWDGIINRFVANFNGSGYQDFSGSIVWRLKINNRYARNLGNVQTTFGDFHTAFVVPASDNIRVISQQTVQVVANIPAGSPVSGPGVVSAGAFGWIYPRR